MSFGALNCFDVITRNASFELLVSGWSKNEVSIRQLDVTIVV